MFTVAEAKSKLGSPGFAPVVDLIGLLARLKESDPRGFRRTMWVLREGLSGKRGVELRDGRAFILLGPFAIPRNVSDG